MTLSTFLPEADVLHLTAPIFIMPGSLYHNVKKSEMLLKYIFEINMLHSNLPEPQLLKALLEPLFEDFLFWFGRAESLFRQEVLPFLKPETQAQLLAEVIQAQQEVTAAQTLFRATGGAAGVDTQVLIKWHQLVNECWRVSHHHRLSRS